MKRNLSDYLVALTVIACSVVLLGALTIALSGFRLQKPDRTLQVNFSDIAGIKLHSEVRYAGAPAGRVIAVRPLSAEERAATPSQTDAVRIAIAINKDVPQLPNDIIVAIGSDTLLSEKFVALTGGTPGAPILADGSLVEGHAAFSIERLTQQAGPLLDHATLLLDNANQMIAQLKSQIADLLPKVSHLVDSVQNLSTGGQTLLGDADKLIVNNEPEIKASLERLKLVLAQAETALHSADSFVGNANNFVGSTDRQLQDRMKELRVILQNLKVVSTQAKAITETLGEKPSRLIWGVGKTNKLTPEATILKSVEPVPAKAP